MELFKANAQWSTRPADQRFESLEDLYRQCKEYADTAIEKVAYVRDIRTEASDGDVVMVGKSNYPAKLTNWAFGQLSARVGAPASYLRQLPATLAVQNLNHGLARMSKDDASGTVSLLLHKNGDLLTRAVTSEKYSRFWNHELAARCLTLQSAGWKPARPTMHWGAPTVGQCIMCSGTGNDGACIYCAGTGREFPALYASDHDCFIFLINDAARVRESGNPDGLIKGVIVENSEVGARSLKLTKFLFRELCGNHIVWGASDVVEISLRHVGDVHDKFNFRYAAEFRKFAEESVSDMEAVISRAKTTMIAGTKDEVLDKLFGMRSLQLSRKTIEAGYDAVVPGQDGNPNSVWGMVQGLTRHSQTIGYADARNDVDKAAGRILGATF